MFRCLVSSQLILTVQMYLRDIKCKWIATGKKLHFTAIISCLFWNEDHCIYEKMLKSIFFYLWGQARHQIARNDPGIYFSSNKAYMYKIIKWNLSGAVYHRKWIWFFLRLIKTISTHSGACSSGWRSAACAQCATNPSCGSTLMPRRVPRVLWSQRKCEVGREETIPLLGKKTQLHLND